MYKRGSLNYRVINENWKSDQLTYSCCDFCRIIHDISSFTDVNGSRLVQSLVAAYHYIGTQF